MKQIKTVIVYTDTHIGAPHATHENADEILQDYKQRGSDQLVIATGDIFDIKNTRKKYINEYIKYRNTLQKEMGKYYIYGNHECAIDPDNNYFQVEDGIMWLHYHVPAWCKKVSTSCDKVTKWEKTKKLGLNKLKYFLYSIGHMISLKSVWDPSSKEIALLVAFAKKKNCNTVIFGHTHKLYDSNHDGVRIINAGRGRHKYDLLK